MKITVNTVDFAKAVKRVVKVIPKNPTRLVMMNVMMMVIPGKIKLVGSDSDITRTIKIDAETDGTDNICIPGMLLNSVMSGIEKQSSAKTIEIHIEKSEATITSGSCSFSLRCMDATEYPPLPDFKKEHEIQPDDHKKFCEALKRVAIACGGSDCTPVQRCVQIKPNFVYGDKMDIVGTDGKRLAVDHFECEIPDDFTSMLILSDSVDSICEILSDSEKQAKIYCSSNLFCVMSETESLYCRTVEGKFPDYNRVIPQKSSVTVKADRQEFLKALKTINPLLKTGGNLVNFVIHKNEITFSSAEQEVGAATISIPIVTDIYDMRIGFNSAFIEDFLTIIDSDFIEIGLDKGTLPGLFRPHEGSFKYVLMPMVM